MNRFAPASHRSLYFFLGLIGLLALAPLVASVSSSGPGNKSPEAKANGDSKNGQSANNQQRKSKQAGRPLRPKASEGDPAITTDRGHYLPGETITFSGTDWAAGEAVTIVIASSSGTEESTLQTTVDDTGSFTVTGTMPDPHTASKKEGSKERNGADENEPDPGEGGSFVATATGASSHATADVEFVAAEADHDGERLLAMESYWILRQAYPTNTVNPLWVRKAAEQDARIKSGVPAGRKLDSKSLKNNPLMLSPLGFTALGPQPERMTGCTGCFDYTTTAGRINDIKIDPTTTTNGSIVAYAASVGGGVWKTTNCCSSSTTWTVMTDDPLVSTTNIDSLTIDPNNHNTIYAGTGDLNYGSFSMGSQGILKSTDAGATWSVMGASVFGAALPVPVGQFPQYQAVGKVRVDPNNSNKVVAGTKTGLYLSYDGGTNWTGPCVTNSFASMRQDITGLELTNMGGGVTRILAAVGVRGFATTVQFNLGQNGANGIYKGTMPASGCPSDFTSIASNANGFVDGATNTNIGSGAIFVNATTGNQVGRIELAVAPSNPDYIYAQVQAIKTTGQGSGCGSAAGCQLGVWVTTNGGTSWTFMTGSRGSSLAECAGSGAGSAGAGSGDYPQNWYDQAVAVDPNNPDRIFVSTFDVWFATRTGTTFYDVTCGYSNVSPKPVHVDQHALAFVPGSSSMLLLGNDGGVHGTLNATAAAPATTRPTWFNMDTGFNTVEFYAGDISGNFASDPTPQAVGGAQDNGPSSVKFAGSPTGPVQWQMGLGGDGFSGQIDPMGTGPSQAVGTITVSALGVAGQQFVIGTQTFTWAATRTVAGTVAVGTSANTAATNIRTAVNADIPAQVTAAGAGASVTITAVTPGAAGNSIPFTETSTNLTMNGGGFLGGTTQGGLPGSLRFWQGNNSGGISRCVSNCTNSGASWSSRTGGWSGDQQSFILPINMFHGGIPGGDDCGPAGPTTGCGHLIAGTTRVWETITGATGTNTWYITNNPAGAAAGPNLTKGTLGNRSFINQVKYSPKFQSVAIVGTNDGNVQIGFNLGTGVASQANWVNVTGSNVVLPNRPILGIALDPTVPAADVPIGYAAVGGFDANTPTTPGHLYRVSCTSNCGSFTWLNKSGNLPDIPIDSVIVNPNFPRQVFAGTDFGLYYTDDVTAITPVWTRFNAGLPNVMIWDMQVDRGSTTLSLWTRSRGAYAWPLPLGPLDPLPTILTTASATGSFGGTVNLSATLTSGGNPVAGKTIDFSLNGNSVGSAPTNGSGVASLAGASLAGINGGLYPTGVGASFAGDSVYAIVSATNSLTVLQAPVITCPASFSVNADLDSCSTNVSFTGAHEATAIGYPAPTITYAPTSGSFTVGTTQVIATATNSEGSNSCNFNVTVNDIQRPTVTAPANVNVSNDTGQCSASLDPGTATPSDNCPGATVNGVRSDALPLNAPYPVGTTTITWTATDASGNTSLTPALQTVTVNDTELPVVSNPIPSPNTLWPPNHEMVNVMVSYTATDNCPGLNCILTVASNEPINGLGDGDTAPDWQVISPTKVMLRSERSGKGNGRIYTITITCTDAANNVTRKTTTVTVPHDQKKGWIPVVTTINMNTNLTGNTSSLGAPAVTSVTAPSLPAIGFVSFDFTGRTSDSHPKSVVDLTRENANLVSFMLGDFQFSALNYDARELAGAKTTFKGFGKVNDSAGYKYVLTVIDGQAPGGGGVDKFRIKIWNEKTGEVVFDNQMGDADDAEPMTPVGDGKSISFPK